MEFLPRHDINVEKKILHRWINGTKTGRGTIHHRRYCGEPLSLHMTMFYIIVMVKLNYYIVKRLSIV